MNIRVTAFVVSHDAPEYLAETLTALQSQTRSADAVVAVDTSAQNEAGEIFKNHGLEPIRLGEKTSLPESIRAAVAQATSAQPQQPGNASLDFDDWYWILHDDSAPQPDALAKMLQVIERSPSVAVIGPKQMVWNRPRQIYQMGLTLTRSLSLFSWVSDELDQAQHDDIEDVLAVGTAGMLVRASTYVELRGLDESAPPLAADMDFSIRARLSGHRVVVEPDAKVRHAGLSIRNQRPRSWLGGDSRTALRKAEIHLRLAYWPMPQALLFWLFLPLLGVLNAVVRIAQKRPNRIASELAAAFWGFFTLFARMRSRAAAGSVGINSLGQLFVPRRVVRQARRNQSDEEEIEQTSFAEVANTTRPTGAGSSAIGLGFVAAGGLWFMIALALLNFTAWPSDIATSGGNLIPLGDDFLQLFKRAGASWQPIGQGFFGPADPQVWLLSTLGALTFWAPSLAVTLFVYLAKALAFATAWRASSLITNRGWVRNLTALGYALWPTFLLASGEGRLPAMVTAVALPLFVFAVSRVAGVGIGSTHLTTSNRWSWVGVGGLLLAAIGAASPSSLPLAILVLAGFAVARLRRLGFLIWIGLPVVALFIPLGWYLTVGLGHPLLLLADPGIQLASPRLTTLFATTWPWLVLPCAVALLALLTRRWALALLLWMSASLASAAAWAFNQVHFADSGFGAPHAPLQFAALAIVLALAVSLDAWLPERGLAKFTRSLVALALTAAPIAGLLLVGSGTSLVHSDGKVLPALVTAESKAGSNLKVLVIDSKRVAGSDQLSAQLQNADGLHLEDTSVAYRYALRFDSSVAGSAANQKLALTVANLVSANGTDLNASLQKLHIGFVLVAPNVATDVSIALESAPELETIGLTDFGRLFQVKQPAAVTAATDENSSFWSITKGVQLAVLAAFVLLALPSQGSRRKPAAESDIFNDSSATEDPELGGA